MLLGLLLEFEFPQLHSLRPTTVSLPGGVGGGMEGRMQRINITSVDKIPFLSEGVTG